MNRHVTLFALIGFCLAGLAGQTAAAPAASAVPPEQTTPQGEDPPGAEDGAEQIPPASEHKGVIPAPDIGDEGIHTEVPDPEAGHEEEVIPPPDTPDPESR